MSANQKCFLECSSLYSTSYKNYYRGLEDYGVIYMGSPVFKIARLLSVAMFSVHLFACIFFRVKIVSASSPEDVTTFYTSKNVPDDVRNDVVVFGMHALRI